MPTIVNTFLDFQKQVLQINENNFDEIAWCIFQFQAENNPLYREYLNSLKHKQRTYRSLADIPFLPIRFFKSHAVKTGNWLTQRLFKSSGTTAEVRSIHHVWDEMFYLNHAQHTFESRFGSLKNFHILCLLPAYDTSYSSLVAMARHFVAASHSSESGFFLDAPKKLLNTLKRLNNSNQQVLLIGVSHALIDLAETGPFQFSHTWVMETGGMKGRKAELTRAELHKKLSDGLGVSKIISEYGMTELLSQAYTTGAEVFKPAQAMRIIIKELNDPFTPTSNTGIVNVIDLANIHSCCFIETQDLGRNNQDGFEVLGRADNSEARGCNLLLQ